MYSRDKTIESILNFYRMIVNHAYLDDSTLLITPSDGWSDISTEGENDVIISLLRHLPCLRPGNSSDRI